MKLSHPKKEGNLRTSKWLSHRVLLDISEMQNLIDILPTFNIYNVSEVVSLDNMVISIEDFLAKYREYVMTLKAGIIVDESLFKATFSCVFSSDPNALYAMQVKEGLYIIKAIQPVIQINFHHFLFSPEFQQFYSMVNSKDSISWGLQFSYPQIYSNSIKEDVIEVFKNAENANTRLFKIIAKWIRRVTNPVPFMFEEKKVRPTFRIGKRCLNWIDVHPCLKNVGLSMEKQK